MKGVNEQASDKHHYFYQDEVRLLGFLLFF